jgi:hypothetical protein
MEKRSKSKTKSEYSKKLIIIGGIFAVFLILVAFTFIINTNKTAIQKGESSFASLKWSTNPGDSSQIQDTHLLSIAPGANLESNENMIVGNIPGGDTSNVLMNFTNLNEIASDKTIISAKLQLYIEPGGENSDLRFHEITADLTYTQATWNERFSSQSWNNLGGDYNSTIIGSIPLNGPGYYNITLDKNTFQKWITLTNPNYGLLLRAPDSSQVITIYSSNNNEQDKRPKLYIEYVTSKPPVINSITSDTAQDNRKSINENITFTIDWSDSDSISNNINIYFCNSSNSNFDKIALNGTACESKTFCSILTPFSNIVSCQYNVSEEDSYETNYYATICDEESCALLEESFYMNHPANIQLINPLEDVTSIIQNPYGIQMQITDKDTSSAMNTFIYLGTQSNLEQTLLTEFTCYGFCSYTWDIGQTYITNQYLTIKTNDFFINNSKTVGPFDIITVDDTAPPTIDLVNVNPNTSITSGEEIKISVNVTDQTESRVFINLTSLTETIQIELDKTKEFISGKTLEYSKIIEAPGEGSYDVIVIASDSFSITSTLNPGIVLNILGPVIITQNETAPNTVLPYHAIRITGEINATDPLKEVYAFLNVPNGFIFLRDYPQNTYVGNISKDEIGQAQWFVAAPIKEGTYTLNITYVDKFSNSWNSSNFQIIVTSNIGGGYSLEMSGYPEVQDQKDYFVELFFKQAGIPINADSVSISIYDPTSLPIIENIAITNNPEQGKYNYTRTISGISGEWKAIISATKNSITYYTQEFFSLVAGIFDIRDIEILNSRNNALDIQFVAENKGTKAMDLWVSWNLTDINGNLLDYANETIGVDPLSEKIININPTTTYVGQARIIIVGYYHGTSDWSEKAGASIPFSITGDSLPPKDDGGSSSGGGGTTPVITIENETIENETLPIKDLNDTTETPKNDTIIIREITKIVENDNFNIILVIFLAILIVLLIIIIVILVLFKKVSLMSYLKLSDDKKPKPKKEKSAFEQKTQNILARLREEGLYPG